MQEQGGYGPQVINDDNSNTHIGRQIPQQPGIGVEATGRTTHANDRKILCSTLSFHWQSLNHSASDSSF
jgi:hypothetical protein